MSAPFRPHFAKEREAPICCLGSLAPEPTRAGMFRLPWKRPEPPPTQEWWFGGPGYTLGAFILWSIYTRGCIALERGQLGRMQPHHAKYTFWCFPLAVLVHAVSYFSESHGVAEVDFFSSLSGKPLDRSF